MSQYETEVSMLDYPKPPSQNGGSVSQRTSSSSWLERPKSWVEWSMNLLKWPTKYPVRSTAEAQYGSEIQSIVATPEQGFLSRLFSFLTGGLGNSKSPKSTVVGGYFSLDSEISPSVLQYCRALNENSEAKTPEVEERKAVKSRLFKDDEEEIETEAQEGQKVDVPSDKLSELPIAPYVTKQGQINVSEVQLAKVAVTGKRRPSRMG